MNGFRKSWLSFWKRHRTSAYFYVSICMGIIGFAFFGLVGLFAEVSLFWLSGKSLNYGMTFMLAFCGAGLFVLSVYVKNPLIIILDYLEKE